MATYFINTDAVSNNGMSHHDEWIQRKIIVTGGPKKYREALSRIRANDVVLVYVNGIGVVATGISLENEVFNATGQERVGSADLNEYHKRVEYVRLAKELLKFGCVDRPKGVLIPKRTSGQVEQITRDPKVRAWSLQRADGRCELCQEVAPFSTDDHSLFLESHHIVMLANGGPDTPENTAALCPNCHRELHFGAARLAKSKVLQLLILEKEACLT